MSLGPAFCAPGHVVTEKATTFRAASVCDRASWVRRRPRGPVVVCCADPGRRSAQVVPVVQRKSSPPGQTDDARGTGKYVTGLSGVAFDRKHIEELAATSAATPGGDKHAEQDEKSLGQKIGDLARSAWFPAGWPHTVSEEYAKYALWNTGRNTFRKANYVLGTTALLYALGLGAKSSVTLSATLNWMLKDGLGMMSKVSASTQISRVLDKDPKLWRMTGDSLMVVSVLVELLAPLKPSYFLLFGSLASLLIQTADAFSGPAYRVFLNSMARNENIGDVSSRGEIHVVGGNLIGLGIGALASILIDHPAVRDAGIDRTALLAALFAFFSAGHLICCRMEIGVVQLRTLNRKRFDIILQEYIKTCEILSVAHVNSIEPLAPQLGSQRVVVGAPILDFAPLDSDMPVTLAHSGERYVLGYESDGKVGILLAETAEERDIMQAMLQAEHFLSLVDSIELGATASSAKGPDGNDISVEEHISKLLSESREWTSKNFSAFERDLSAKGWVPRLLFNTGKSRYHDPSSAPSHLAKSSGASVSPLNGAR